MLDRLLGIILPVRSIVLPGYLYARRVGPDMALALGLMLALG